jgi:hypothetical protein
VFLTNHVLAGALIGTATRRPWVAAVAGFASHIAMDAIPHYICSEERFLPIAVADGLSGAAIMAVVVATAPRSRRVTLTAGILGACLLDADKPGKQFFGRSPFPASVDRFHAAIQTESPEYLPREAVAGAVLAAAVVPRLRRGRRYPDRPMEGRR